MAVRGSAAAVLALGVLGGVVVIGAAPASASPAPVVTLVTPPAGGPDGGLTVSVYGNNFDTTPGNTTIDFGTTPATGVSCSISDGTVVPILYVCTAVSPAFTIPEGDTYAFVDVTVTSDGQTSSTSSVDQFLYYDYTPCTFSSTGGVVTQPLGSVSNAFYTTGASPGSDVSADCHYLIPHGWAGIITMADPLGSIITPSGNNLAEVDLPGSYGVGNIGSSNPTDSVSTTFSLPNPFQTGGTIAIAGLGSESVVGDTDSSIATCPPPQNVVDSGMVGCSLAAASGSSNGGEAVWSQDTIVYSGGARPQTPSATPTLSTVQAGGSPEGIASSSNWWGSYQGAPYTKTSSDFLAGNIPAPTVWLAPGDNAARSSAAEIPASDDDLSVTAATYACENTASSTQAPNPCTFTPTALTGTFTVPQNTTAATEGSPYTVFIDEPNVTPLAGNGPNDAYQALQDSSCTPTAPVSGGCFGTVEASFNITVLPFANPPQPPTNVSATATGNTGEASVSWTPPTNDGGSPLTGYTITPTPACPSCTGLDVTPGTETSTDVEGLTDGTSYTFTVAATNLAGTSAPSSSTNSVTPYGPPLAPAFADATATGASGQVVVNWAAAGDNGSALTGYTITPSPACPSCTGLSPGPSATSATIGGLTDSTGYTFTVTASNAAGAGSPTTSNSATPYVTTTVPGAPTAVNGTATGTSNPTEVTVTWTAPAVTNGAITGYTVTPSPACGSCTGTSVGDVTSATIDGLTDGPYTFTVTATNGSGPGPASVGSQPVALPPPPPTAITATATGYTGEVSLGWTPASDGGSPLTGYLVTLASGPSCTCTGLNPGPTATGTTIDGLTDGDTYTFDVQAVNAVGDGVAAVSPAVTPANELVPPDPPTDVTATATGNTGEATVTWTLPDFDGNGPLQEFIVTETPLCATCTGGVVDSGTATSTNIEGLTDGTSYTFVAVARNASYASTSSDPSAAITPYGPPSAPTDAVAALGPVLGQITVSWTAPADDNGADLTGYTITPTPACASCTGLSAGPSATSTAIAGLTYGQGYTFTVEAENGAPDPSDPSNVTRSVVPNSVPDAPTAVSAVAHVASVTVTFTVPADNGLDLRTFVFVPTVDGVAQKAVTHPVGTVGSALDPTAGAVDTFTITKLPNGAAVSTTVAAENKNGTGPASSSSNAVVPSTVPDRPTQPTANSSDSAATVVWSVPGNGGSAITSFTITPETKSGKLAPIVAKVNGTNLSAAPGATDAYTVTGLANGTAYQYTVAATNVNGTGQASGLSPPSTPYSGYWLVGADGNVYAYGQAKTHGSLAGHPLNAPIVAMASAPNGVGYWLVGADGGVYSFGHAGFFGSTGGDQLNAPIVTMAATPDGNGYWLVASDGGVFSFGDAHFYGSTGAIHLNKPIVGMQTTPDGRGYWLVASDGGVFSFGDAKFYGSTGAIHLNQPIVGMASNPTGGGYWLVASDGGIFAFGRAGYYGSGATAQPYAPVIGMAPTQTGKGYWLAERLGGVLAFGNAAQYPTAGVVLVSARIVGVSFMH